MLRRVSDELEVKRSNDDDDDDDDFCDPTRGEWVYACSQRPHTHDVRALVCGVVRPPTNSVSDSSGGSSGGSSGAGGGGGGSSGDEILLSGGVDTQVCWLSTTHFERSRIPGRCPSMPSTSTFSVSKQRRLLAVSDETTLNIWRLGARESAVVVEAEEEEHQPLSKSRRKESGGGATTSVSGSAGGRVEMSEGHVLEVSMDLSTTSEGRHIVSSDLSSDGKYVRHTIFFGLLFFFFF